MNDPRTPEQLLDAAIAAAPEHPAELAELAELEPEIFKAPAIKTPAKRKPKAVTVAAAPPTVHKGATPKPLKNERSGQFIQRVILEKLWKGTDVTLAAIVLKNFPKQVTTQKDVAWNRWKLRKQGKLAKH